MENSSLLLAIGPSDIASISIAKDIPGAIVVDDPRRIRETLIDLCQLDLESKRKALHEYALANYNLERIRNGLYSDFLKLCANGK